MPLILLLVGCASQSPGSRIVNPDNSVDLTVTLDGQPYEMRNVWAFATQVEPTDGCTPSSWLLLHNSNSGASLRLNAFFPAPFVTGVVSTLASLPFDDDHLPTLMLDKGIYQGPRGQWVATHGGQVTFTADDAWSNFELLFEDTMLCPGNSLDELSERQATDCSPAELKMTMMGTIGQGKTCTEGTGGEGALCTPPLHPETGDWSCESDSATGEG